MRTGFALLAAMVVLALAAPAQAQLVKLQGVWDETGKTYQTIDFDAVTGWPIVECTTSDGAGNPISSTGGALNVSVAALPLPAGAATAAKQDTQTALLTTIDADTGILAADPATATLQGTGNTSLATIAGDTTSLNAKIPALGTALTAASLPVNIASDQTVPISAAALPLPTGAATEATSASILADTADIETNTDFGATTGGGVELGALRVTIANDSTGLVSIDDNGASITVDGTFWQATQPISAATLPLPTGAATEATLATIDADTGNIATDTSVIAGDTTSIDGKTPALGQALMAASTPVAIASDQSTLPISAAALPLPAGAATSALQLPDGHNVTVDNAGAGSAVNIQDGGNSITVDGTFWPALGQALMAASLPVVVASNQSTIPVNTATGTVVDSALAPQDLLWRNVADGGATADANKGVIPTASIVAGTVVKLYQIPEVKQHHEISITMTDSDANAFEWEAMIYAVNDVPSAAWALDDWLSVGALVVPSFKVSRDRTKTVVAQPLIQTRATYLLVVVNAVTVAPVGNPRVRIISYNNGDSR